MKAYIGIDIAKNKCDYCVLNGSGKIVERGQYQNTIQGTKQFAEGMASKYRKKEEQCRAACESTANMWLETYNALESARINIMLAHPYKIALVTKDDKKTDKVNVYKIAELLRLNTLHPCPVSTPHVRGIRDMIWCRVRPVQDRTRIINRVRNILDAYNMTTQVAKLYSKAYAAGNDGIRHTLGYLRAE